MQDLEKALLKEIYEFNQMHNKPYEVCSGKPGKLKEELKRLGVAKKLAEEGLIELEALNREEVFATISTKGRIFVASQ